MKSLLISVYNGQRSESLQHRQSLLNAYSLSLAGLMAIAGGILVAPKVTAASRWIIVAVVVIVCVSMFMLIRRQRAESEKAMCIMRNIENHLGLFSVGTLIPNEIVLPEEFTKSPHMRCGLTSGDWLQARTLLLVGIGIVSLVLFRPSEMAADIAPSSNQFATTASQAITPPPVPTTATQPITPAPVQPSLNDKERELMLQNIRTVESYDDKLLRTVHWTLTSVFAVALLLVGYNWITSHKIAELQAQRLQKETLNETTAAVQRLGSELETKIQKAIVSMDDKSLLLKNELVNVATSLNANAEQRTIQFADESTQRLEAHRRETDEALRAISNEQLPTMQKLCLSTIGDAIAALDKKFRNELDSNVAFIKAELTYISWKLYNNLGEQSSTSIPPVWGAALLWYVIAAKVACQGGEGYEWMLSQPLMNIARCIEKGATPSKFAQTTFADLGELVPAKMRDEYHRINELLQRLEPWDGET
jgi:uncharacterized membrane protein YhhN